MDHLDLLQQRIELNGTKRGLKIPRVFTKPGDKLEDVFNYVEWDKRKSEIKNPDGSIVFEMDGILAPKFWTQTAVDILAQKYFRKRGVPQYDEDGNPIRDQNGNAVLGPEKSIKQIIKRLSHFWRVWGEQNKYFATPEDAETFEAEVGFTLLYQMSSPNSPQWFNAGLALQYGITGTAQGHWYFDDKTGVVIRSEDAYTRGQLHACFIQPIKDDLVNEGGILDTAVKEARIFKYGSGTGTNFSTLRAKGESLSGGGGSSGLMSFLRIFDTVDGCIKSGGTTRRAAKMVIVNVDHPEIEDFIMWKVLEEKKYAALVKAGLAPLDMDVMSYTVFGQNSNNSVRVTNDFMQAVLNDQDWNLTARTDGRIMKTLKAKELWSKIAQAAWSCADPGLQFDTIVNDWNTSPATGRINATNPCSEFHFLDNTACNLSSLNLMKFYDADTNTFDTEKSMHASRLWTIVLEISVLAAQFPSREIAEMTYKTRNLGLGYTNLGALLMVMGFPYDSEEGRNIAAAITALMTAESFATSAEMAGFLGPYPEYTPNRDHMLRVVRNHRRAAYNAKPEEYENLSIKPVGINHKFVPGYLLKAAIEAWDRALDWGERFGYRNAQLTLIAPTGTISFVMDADTTGMEPDFALVKFKKLAGGGFLKIINRSIPLALKNLGYDEQQTKEIIEYMIGTNSLRNSLFINRVTLKQAGFTDNELDKVEKELPKILDLNFVFNPVFLGEETMRRLGFRKEDYSKADFNLLKSLGYSDAEIEVANEKICGMLMIEGAPHLKQEHYPIFDCAVKCGKKGQRFVEYMAHVKTMAAIQPFLSGSMSKTVNMPAEATAEEIQNVYMQAWKLGLKCIAIYRDGSKVVQAMYSRVEEKEKQEMKPIRRKMPSERKAVTHKFKIGEQEGYITVGLFDDGKPGELFVSMAKQGSTLAGLMDSFAIAISIGLQYGVPLNVLVDKFSHTRFEPSGWTDNPQIQVAKSIMDYIFRWMALKFLPEEERQNIGFNKQEENGNGYRPITPITEFTKPEKEEMKFDMKADAPTCRECGSMMVRSGSCYTCTSCGSTTGCS